MFTYHFFLQFQNDNSSRNLVQLLLNDAFSNYVVFFLGILFGIIGWKILNYISRKKPQIIEVVHKEQVSLLKIDSQVERDIKVEYKGKSIASLQRTSFSLFNKGEEKIENITLTIYIDDLDLQQNVLNWLILDSNQSETTDANASIIGQGLQININFLNPFKAYKDELTLHIFSSRPLKVNDAKGRGLGWGVTYFDQIEFQHDVNRNISLIGGGNWFSLTNGLVNLCIVLVRNFLRS
jgi:hypothetical protein